MNQIPCRECQCSRTIHRPRHPEVGQNFRRRFFTMGSKVWPLSFLYCSG